MDKKFYVYVHKYASGPKHGQVFYVGKGSGRRSGRAAGRGEWWKRIVDKYGFSHSIVARFEREECSFSFEIALIKWHGRQSLCNLSDGGEGASGVKRSPEHIAKWVAAINGVPKTDVHKEKLRVASLESRSDPLVIKKISEATRKAMARPEVKKRTIDNHPDFSGHKNPRANMAVFRFIHKDGCEFTGTQYEFYTEKNLPQASCNAFTKGKFDTFKGWSIDRSWRG